MTITPAHQDQACFACVMQTVFSTPQMALLCWALHSDSEKTWTGY